MKIVKTGLAMLLFGISIVCFYYASVHWRAPQVLKAENTLVTTATDTVDAANYALFRAQEKIDELSTSVLMLSEENEALRTQVKWLAEPQHSKKEFRDNYLAMLRDIDASCKAFPATWASWNDISGGHISAVTVDDDAGQKSKDLYDAYIRDGGLLYQYDPKAPVPTEKGK